MNAREKDSIGGGGDIRGEREKDVGKIESKWEGNRRYYGRERERRLENTKGGSKRDNIKEEEREREIII